MKRLRRLRRRFIPHPRCTIQITLTTKRKTAKGKISFWWPDREWNLKRTIDRFLCGVKTGVDFTRAVRKAEEKRLKRSRRKEWVIRNPHA